MILVILIPLLIAYLVTGLVVSRNYHGKRAIAWEESYAKCDECHNRYFSSDRDHHSYCHDSRAKYKFNSIMLIPLWPLLGPIVGIGMGGKSLKSFYLKPVKDWEAGQRYLIQTRDEYKDALKEMKESHPDYKITKDALLGIESQIVMERRR